MNKEMYLCEQHLCVAAGFDQYQALNYNQTLQIGKKDTFILQIMPNKIAPTKSIMK